MTRRLRLTACTAAFVAALAAFAPASTAPAQTPVRASAAVTQASITPALSTTFALYYHSVKTASELAKLGNVKNIVVSPQANDVAAAKAIHARGAKAFRYVQAYWYPVGQTADGLNISKDPSWAFCKTGKTKLVGKSADGRRRWYLDTNNRNVRNWFLSLLRKLKADGYNGVMMDRGLAALTGNSDDHAGIWDRRSTCGTNPASKTATFSDAYANLAKLAHKAGLKLLFNYGSSPFDLSIPMRPNPRDASCRAGHFSTCHQMHDLYGYVDYYLDEAVAHPKDTRFSLDFHANQANERNYRIGQTVGLITQATLGNDTSKHAVFFQYARIRLFNMPVAIFTGSGGCKTGAKICNRQGLYPQLSNASLGRPIASGPGRLWCVSHSAYRCIWYRPYTRGIDVVNVSPYSRGVTVRIPGSRCMVVTDLYTGKKLGGGKCVRSIRMGVAAWGGRPLKLAVR